MNRLTQSNGKGGHYFPECFKRCNGEPGDCNNCDVNLKVCEALAAYEETGLTPEDVVSLKNTPILNRINLHGAAFAEAEEQLNDELSEAVRILRKSPMFEGRVTMAIVISNEGRTVRPILYRTKYAPKQYTSDDQPPALPGQLAFENEV